MHLKSVTLKGFKSFPDRTRLEFDPGVSVVVGPNGSGKSNVTDAILWALGEQKPLAIRGQSMQDVIFGGGRGVAARNAAEVELVLDNSDGTVDLPVGEISVVRRLERSGEGGYRLNGAKARLTDVQEVLSDTGLGKEAHSVISQGRVEAIVTSKPKDRRLLIEEAAGLGKHRKRRRRAQLKLDRTRGNLDQALLVEQEARKQLGPLKRQAEAAELHERLERQTVEARWELVRDGLRERRAQLAAAAAESTAARAEQAALQAGLDAVVAERREAEEALAQQAQRRDRLSSRARRVASSAERIELRVERVSDRRQALAERIERRREALGELEAAAAADRPDEVGASRIAALEAEMERLDQERQETLEREVAVLQEAREAAERELAAAQAAAQEVRDAGAATERRAEEVRARRRELDQAVERARREAATVGAQLAAANQFLRGAGGLAAGRGGRGRGGALQAVALSDGLRVDDGYELAVAAALDGRLGAAVADDPAGARELLGQAGRDGLRVLLADSDAATADGAAADADGRPDPGAEPLGPHVSGDGRAVAIARRALADAWLVDALPDAVPVGFTGTLVTVDGLVWRVGAGELQRSPQGGEERVLAERNRRDRLVAESEQAARAEHAAVQAVEALRGELAAVDRERESAEQAAREARRGVVDAEEAVRDAVRAVQRRQLAPDEGPAAVRRAQIVGELQAERRTAERLTRERAERAARVAGLEEALRADEAVVPTGERITELLLEALRVVRERAAALERAVQEDRAAGDDVAGRLRSCAGREAELATALRRTGERLTTAEVAFQRAKDQEAEILVELGTLAERLGLPAEPAEDALDPETVQGLRDRIAKLTRRREQLGPVNPLATEAYDEAREHVETLETQRTDLETALRELRAFVRDTDRQIRETFEQTFTACARNFEELAEHVFPGGRGRLRLVRESDDAQAGDTEDGGEPSDAALDDAEGAGTGEDEDLGVEIEITPAGKQMKRLTLMSGGEKTMTAIAFLFSVFLAKPSPFYVLDEVEAALDDLNIDRFLQLLRRYRDRAQFIVVTHQKRTMDVADALYGVSMGGDGVSKVVSRRLDQSATRAEPLPGLGGVG
ncbi:chromosome segregation SMC family protein [Patulibacter americanus]|uniref:chromosome segregation SMC family protein n=1 Tax=Patulibacter americanus TaxID=588672 RepID=UPI0003B6D319|nr:AAA family ATPase [Patulibacter americanus]